MANTMLVHFARWVAFLGGDERDIGWIMSTGAVSAVLMRPWVGGWIDRLGPRRTWAFGSLLFSTTMVAYLFVDTLGPLVYALRVLNMLAAALVFTSMLTYLSHTAPPSRLVEAIGSLGAAGFVGMIMGPLLGDVFLSGVDRTYGSFVVLFGVGAALVLAGLVGVAFLRPAPPHPEARRTAFIPAVRKHWPGMVLLISISFGVCMAVPFGFLAKFIDEAALKPIAIGKISIGAVGVYFVLYAVCGIALRVVFRKLPARIGRRRQLVIGMSFMSVGMLSFLLVDRTWLLVVPALLCGTAHSLAFHTMTALVMQSFPDHLRGMGSALALMALDGGMVGGGPVLGEIAFHMGYDAMFVCIALFTAGAIAAFWLASLPVWRKAAEQRATLCPPVGS